jgi:hypothetical protein
MNGLIPTPARLLGVKLALIGLGLISGCGQSEPPATEAANTAGHATTRAVATTPIPPPVPQRAPLDVSRFSNNIYKNICLIGRPFLVKGWTLDPDTRFVYFTGPFTKSNDGSEPKPYLYMSIPAPQRQRIHTTLLLNDIEREPALEKPGELQKFQLPSLAAVDSNPAKIEQRFGKPDVTRELKRSGRTRIIYNRRVCFNAKLLAGMYFDIEDGEVVKAKGVGHPESMKWVMSGNRPPAPDTQPTYYLDQKPREDSPQAILIGLIASRESGDADGARELISSREMAPAKIAEVIKDSQPGKDIKYETLTYQTTRYKLDEVDVTVRYQLENGRDIVASHQLRKEEDGWRVSR